MSGAIVITRAGPLASVQDEGRFGQLEHGVTASGPMDRRGFRLAGAMLGVAGAAGIEITAAGIRLRLDGGSCRVGLAGGAFGARHNGVAADWPGVLRLDDGDVLEITPGLAGNYGYLRFDHELLVPMVLGSQATNSRVGLGGLDGRAMQAGERLGLGRKADVRVVGPADLSSEGPIRVIWGIHAELFSAAVRNRFAEETLVVSGRMDRMGVVLDDRAGIFAGVSSLSLVSDPIVAGDIQILGNGTPTVLMRDHQPTGGYPRIATVISADLDRLAQMRPGTELRFLPVTVEHAHIIARAGGGA
ncbi:biotin-dependent carboxyltransferase family protein [Devosia sp.]|uniref:5-oxoprolinase subunit C family protein n=1 Tax=Devosia sp. TaxID=1871048 RepID=UPI0032649C39